MAATAEAPTLTRVTQPGGNEEGHIRDRRLRLGLSVSALARRAHVDRDTLTRAEEDEGGTRPATMATIERALSELEQEMGMTDPETTGNVVRFVVSGIYGADSLVVEGPVENIDELERAVDKIMRRLRDEDQ